MATDAQSNVTVAISVVDKATPAIESITTSLNKVEEAQKQINETAAKMVEGGGPYPELAKLAKKNIWNLPTHGDVAPLKNAAELQADYWKDAAKTRGATMPDLPDVTPQVREAQGALGTLAETAERVWRKIKGGFEGAFESVVATARKIGKTLGPIFQTWLPFGVGFAFSTMIDAFTSGMQELVATVDKLGPQARNMGITIQELQRLTEWAKESGVPVKTVAAGLEDLTKTLGAVEMGTGPGSKRAAKAIADLMGEGWSGKGKSPIEILKEFAGAFQAIDDPQRRAADAAGIFTGKWREMLPLLMQGPEAIDKAIETSKKLGEISPEMQKRAEEYTKAMAQLGTAWTSMKQEIGAAALPIVTPAIQELTDFIAENREAVTGVFKGAAEAVLGFFREVGPIIKATADEIQTIKGAFTWLEEHMPKLKAATPVGPLIESALPASFELPPPPDVSKWQDPVTKLRDVIEEAAKAVERFFGYIATKGDEILWGIFDKIRVVWESIATAIKTAVDSWQTFRGIKPESWVAGSVPGVPAPPPGPSPGGGPLSWEDLAGARGGFVPQAPNGEVKVTIENKNPPPGTRTTATATGPGVSADVGQSMPWSAPSYSGPWAPAGA